MTAPFPVPLLPEVTASQFALDVADHVHELPVVTETVSEPPTGGRETLDRETVYTQEGREGDEQPIQKVDTASPKAMSLPRLRTRRIGTSLLGGIGPPGRRRRA